MNVPMSRAGALAFLEEKIRKDSLRKHCLASEAVMRRLAEHFGENVEAWGVLGLLHDIDPESIDDDETRHGLVGAEWLGEKGFPAEALVAVRAHNGDVLGIEPSSQLDLALTAAESITGLVSATAMIYPSKKLADVKLKSLRKRMKERRFAANVSRERIRYHERLDLSFDEFAGMALEAMQGVAESLGL